MLEPAIKYRTQLDDIQYSDIWFNDKYKYWNASTYYGPIAIDGDTWNRHQFVSSYNGNIIGYISYDIQRDANIVHSLNIINFTDNHIVFGKDLARAIRDIFEKYAFRKINFFVIVGNPVEKSYDRMVTKYGGRVVGTYADDVKLIDGKYYDRKAYEILSENYFESKSEKLFKLIKARINTQ